MSLDAVALARRLRRLYPKRRIQVLLANPDSTPSISLEHYKDDCVAFAREVLGVELTPDQQEIVRAFPGRVKVNSGHSVGKSYLAAVLTLWWFFTRNPSVIVTTAPTKHHVETVLWTEIRMLAMRAIRKLPPQFLPKAAKIWDHPDHWAEGVTTSSGEGFQGRHRSSMLFIMDECEDVDSIYWTATDTMYQPENDHGWLAIGNPLTTSTQSYLEDLATGPDGQPKWKLFSLSALNHPNVIAELTGKPPIIPNAVTLNQVRQWIQDWTDPVYPGDQQPEDVEWPPGSGTFIRPGPTFKARVLGVRPSSGVDTVFSLAAWNRMLTPSWNNDQCWMSGTGIQIGVDPAAYGDDFTALHVKSGPLSLHHESHNGWNVDKTAGRIKELCSQYSHQYNSWAQLPRPQMKPTDVDVLIEADGGLGVGVFSHRDQFHRWKLVTVGGSSSIVDINNSKMYYNVRSQIWIEAARKAIAGQMDISRLAQDVKERLRLQLLSPSYEVRPDGCRKVESKDEIKKRLKRSPDDGDAILISHYSPASYTTTMVLKTEQAD